MRIQNLREQYNSVVKLLLIEYAIVIVLIKFVATCLLEGCIEYFNAEFIRYDIPLNGKHDELSEFHSAFLCYIKVCL